MCEQIREFDFAMWEKDCAVESLRKHRGKHLKAKSETSEAQKTVDIPLDKLMP